MKLLRYGQPNEEQPGILDDQGRIRDLSGVVDDIAGPVLSAQGLASISSLAIETLPLVTGTPRLGPPVDGMRNFVCIGLNYADHAAETGMTPPSEPIVFLKSLSAVCGPNDGIIIPRGSKKTDWEAELAVVIGATARRVPQDRALDFVAGYTVCNDVSEREWQNERGGSWDKGKGFDHFGPLGPWLVTRDEIADPQNLNITLDVDGHRMQTGNTTTMIFKITQLIAYVTRCITLYPGDVISTGTPPGVGIGRKPNPVFLKPEQTVRLGIDGLGEQVHRTRAA